MRPSPQPRSATTSLFRMAASSSIRSTTSCGVGTKMASGSRFPGFWVAGFSNAGLGGPTVKLAGVPGEAPLPHVETKHPFTVAQIEPPAGNHRVGRARLGSGARQQEGPLHHRALRVGLEEDHLALHPT